MTRPSIEELMLDVATHQETGDSLIRVMKNATDAGLKLPAEQIAEWTNLLHRTGHRPTKPEPAEYPIARRWSDLPNLKPIRATAS